MDVIVATRHLDVVRLGGTARDLLTTSSWGRVLAAMSNAVYLETAGGQLVWLTTVEAPMHGRGLSLGGTLPRPAPGSTFVVRDESLALDEGTVLNWRRASLWRPPPLCDDTVLNLSELAQYVLGIRSFIDALPAPRGLGVMLGPILDFSQGRSPVLAAEVASPILRLARPALSRIVGASRALDLPGMLTAAESLIGLGEGLTPSGDDLVGGMLFGAAVLREAYGLPERIPPDDLQRFLMTARQRTHRISFSLLCDYASGKGPEALHQYTHALLAGESAAVVGCLAAEVVRIGHSTGWDCLTGLWAALGMVTAAAPASMTHRPHWAGGCRGNVKPWTSNRRYRKPTTKQRAA
jgi:hypothetical protein